MYAWAVGRDRNICTMERANQNFKIFEILKNDKFEQKFETLNDFRCKSDEYKSCSTHQDLQLLFWSSCYLTKFEPFKFWLLFIRAPSVGAAGDSAAPTVGHCRGGW